MKGDGFLDRTRSSHVGAAGTCGRGVRHVRRIDTTRWPTVQESTAGHDGGRVESAAGDPSH
jgi:hypothetical protein